LLNGGKLADCEKVPEVTARNNRLRLYPNDTVVFAKSGMSATLGRVYRLPEPAYVVSHLAALVPTGSYDPGYLTYWLRRNPPSHLIKDPAYPSIRTSEIEQVEVPNPPLSEQARIAAILDKADAVRCKRERARAAADDFLKSVFLEMFGDPVVNTKNWPLKPLGLVCKKITDGTHDTPPRQSSGAMFITGKNIRPFAIDRINVEFVSDDVHREIYRRCNPEYGDVLYTNIGAGTGNAAFNDLTFEFSMKNVALLKPDAILTNGRYLEFLLNDESFKRRLISRFGQGGAQGFLGLKTIKSIEIPLPPVAQQTRFTN
jgi:type I restriction enzyme S subunit